MISPDGAALPSAAPDAIHYPDIAVPEMGQVLPVQQGVWWLRMPLPISLDHINLWLLEETGGYALVDTGMATDAAREVWDHLSRTLLVQRPLTRILLTHLHPDHAGLAAWLQQRFGVPVWTSAATLAQLGLLLRKTTPQILAARTAFFAGHGVEPIEEMNASLDGRGYRDSVDGVPEPGRLIVDNDLTQIGARLWRWLETGGRARASVPARVSTSATADRRRPGAAHDFAEHRLDAADPRPEPAGDLSAIPGAPLCAGRQHAGAAIAWSAVSGTCRAGHRDPPAS
jgi:glyoxylase-like metal-dependent hydrolase (beta-lactamase superfamily II)